jgi:hypothetical protein
MVAVKALVKADRPYGRLSRRPTRTRPPGSLRCAALTEGTDTVHIARVGAPMLIVFSAARRRTLATVAVYIAGGKKTRS